MQYRDSFTKIACVLIAPSSSVFSSGSSLARGWYCCNWFVLSLSHCALMSPVTMKLWAFLGSLDGRCHLTVVSSVFGKQFSNSRARSTLAIFDVISLILASTTFELKRRHSGAGRWYGTRYSLSVNGGWRRPE